MGKAVRQHAAAGFALMGATVIAVTPIASPTQPAIQVANLETRLAASVANIPANLVYALANVPNSEVQAVNQVAGSLLHSGTWIVVSATNIWGTDAGDPGHWESLASLLVPFPAISRVLGKQLAMIAAAELPTSDSCDAEGCFPVTPLVPITGISVLDSTIQTVAVLTGQQPLALVQNWFKVPLSELMSGYTFPEQVVSPSGPAYAGFGFPGTYPDPVTGQPLLPWSGQTFIWNPFEPLTAFYDSLTATPQTPANAITIPTVEQAVRAFQALLAGVVVAFNPFAPGSPLWLRELTVPEGLTSRAIVKFIGDIYPGNAVIDEWLTAMQTGTANGPTDAQVAGSIELLQTGVFTLRPATLAKVNSALAGINPVLPDIAAHSGLLAGRNLVALFADIKRLIGGGSSGNSQPVGPAATTQPPAEAVRLSAAMPGRTLAATGHSARTPAVSASSAPEEQGGEDGSRTKQLDIRPTPAAAATAGGTAASRSALVDRSDDAQPPSGSTRDRTASPSGGDKSGSARTGAGGGEAGHGVGRHRAS